MNLRALVKEKKERTVQTKVPFNDINKDLIITIFGINVLGKDGRDDEVIEIILNEIRGKADVETMKAFGDHFNQRKAEFGKEFKKQKDGHYRINGKVVLQPKNM